jgi:cyclase
VDLATVDELADECFMPLTVGGGIRTIEDVQRLLRVGADKVSINTDAVETPSMIREVADRFGSQCVVVSIDFRRHPDGRAEVYTHSGTRPTGLDPVDLACRAEVLGAGEILLTSIERDGAMVGYDLEVTRRVGAAVSVPVVASGGGGNYQHMAEALSAGATDVAASAIFLYTQQTPLEAKRYLAARGFPTRLGNH